MDIIARWNLQHNVKRNPRFGSATDYSPKGLIDNFIIQINKIRKEREQNIVEEEVEGAIEEEIEKVVEHLLDSLNKG